MNNTDAGKGYYLPSWGKKIRHNRLTSLVNGQASIRINWPKVLLLIASFFVARAALMGEVMPFGLIFWALMMRIHPEKKFVVTGGVLLGWLTLEGGLFPPWFLPASMLLWKTVDFLFEKAFKKYLPLFLALPLVVLTLRLPLLWTMSFPVYETTVVVLEAVLALFLPPLLQPFLREMEAISVNQGTSPEGAVGGVLILALFFLGMNGIVFLENVVLLNVLVPLMVLMGAYLWGAVPGMLFGIMAGISLSLSNPALFPYTGALGISAFVAGLLKPYRRVWAGAAYFVMFRFLAYFALEGGYHLTAVWEDFVVLGLFLLLPVSFWETMRGLNISLPFRLDGPEHLRLGTVSRIKEFAAVFQELAATFRPLDQAEAILSKRDLSPMVEYFSRRVCTSCDHYQRCWKGDLYNQNRRVMAMLSATDEKGVFTEKMIPVRLRRYCPRQMEIVKTVGNMRELYRLNCYWQEKIREGRMLVSEQLQGISSVMHDLAQEVELETDSNVRDENGKKALFTLEVGVAQVARDGQSVSGDSFAILPVRGGKQVILLSDGMGSGKEARQASLSAVRLTERLFMAGFQREIVVSTINTLLRLRYPAERFATMDMALLDLCRGEMELFKLGAPPSLVKNGLSVMAVGSGSLPMGILEEITPERKICPIGENGTTLVMVTDGLWDDGEEGENWLVPALKGIRHEHPQIIADRLIEEACTRYPRGVQDDLTVLVGSLRPLRKKNERQTEKNKQQA